MGGDGFSLPSQLPPIERRCVTADEELALYMVRRLGSREAFDRLFLTGRYEGAGKLRRKAR